MTDPQVPVTNIHWGIIIHIHVAEHSLPAAGVTSALGVMSVPGIISAPCVTSAPYVTSVGPQPHASPSLTSISDVTATLQPTTLT